MVVVRVPKNTASLILHAKDKQAVFNQRKRGSSSRFINFPANTPVALREDCEEIEVVCSGPCELEWFP